MVQWEKDSMYGLTLVWALTAVYGEQSAPLVAVSALVCIGVLLIVVLLRCRAARVPGAFPWACSDEGSCCPCSSACPKWLHVHLCFALVRVWPCAWPLARVRGLRLGAMEVPVYRCFSSAPRSILTIA